jgi:meso-butanediol dehydrogenase/(S,S)-butanediol dehydrogenase/diacetyl reductase
MGIAVCLAKAGAKVVVADLDLQAARRTAKEVIGQNAMACPVDVTDEDSVRSMVQLVLARHGRLDILVNCAGIMFRTRFMGISQEE